MSAVPVSPVPGTPRPDAPAPPPSDQPHWHALLNAILTTPLPLGVDSAPIPPGTHPLIMPAIDEAFDAGIMTGTGIPTSYEIIRDIIEAFDCQRRYYRHGLQRGIQIRLAALTPQAPAPPAPTPPAPAPAPEPRTRAPKLNPPKPFDGTRSQYKTFMTQLSLVFNSDPAQYPTESSKIAYAASYLSGTAGTWFQPNMNSSKVEFTFTTWATFVEALRAAFDDPDAYQTAERQILALKQDRDCSSYHAAFVPLATILGYDARTKISYFRRGLHRELRKALSYQGTTPEDFDAFVQLCIKIDNQIRAERELRDPPRTQGGQFTSGPGPSPSTSTGTHSGPMDLSASTRQHKSQKRGPVTPIEKKRRRENNLCLYCGSPGHWASQCPHKKMGRTAAAATIDEGVALPATISYTPVVPTIPVPASAAPAQILYEAKN